MLEIAKIRFCFLPPSKICHYFIKEIKSRFWRDPLPPCFPFFLRFPLEIVELIKSICVSKCFHSTFFSLKKMKVIPPVQMLALMMDIQTFIFSEDQKNLQ